MPKGKGRPRKTPLEAIAESPAPPVKRGRGRPKKAACPLAERIAVPKPVMPYFDVHNDPYVVKSKSNTNV